MTPLAGPTHAGIEMWLAMELSRVAPSTTRSHPRALSSVLKYAIGDGRLARNPADGVEPTRVVSRKHGYLTHAQLHQFAELRGPDGDAIMFLACAGLRWGEMAALRVMDLDMLRRRVNVDRAVTEVGGRFVYGTPKNHGRRSLPFPSFLSEMLGMGEAERLRLHVAGGRPIRSKNWRARRFEPEMAKMRKLHPDLVRLVQRDLGHTAASLAIAAGANVRAVQKMRGHASAAMTLDVYADLFDNDLDS